MINLGTNDAPSGAAGICPNKNFTDATTAFVLNAARVYRNPMLPVFVAQGPMNCGEEVSMNTLSRYSVTVDTCFVEVFYTNKLCFASAGTCAIG